MLNYVLYLILYMLLLSVYSRTEFLNDDMQKYLANKAAYVNHGLTSIARMERDAHSSFELVSHRTNRLDNLTSFELVELFNKTYAFDGTLYEIIPGEYNFLARSADLFNFNLKRWKFIRTIQFNNFQFILVCLQSGICNVYTAKNIDNIVFVHSIENPNFIQDSKFFVNDNKLYLVTTSSVPSSLSTTIIYEWLETYFDNLKEISSMGAVSVFTFAMNESEIIIFLQNSTAWKENSLIYEFRNNHLTKIQQLRIINPYCMKKYVFNNHTFLVIFNKSLATLNKWHEMEMVHLADFPISKAIEKVRISYVDNIPILFIITKTELLSYSLNENFRSLLNYTFEQPFEKIYDMETMKYNDKNFLYFAGRTKNGSIELNSIRFSLYLTETDSKVYENNRLTSCISTLQTKINEDQRKLNHVIEVHSKEIFETSPALGRSNAPEKWTNKLDFVLEHYNKAFDILKGINITAKDLFQKNNGIFDGRMNLLGELHVSLLNAKTMYVNKLNSIDWIPEKWLSYDTVQTLTGKITTEAFKVENLWLPKGNMFESIIIYNIENALLLNVNQRLYGKSKFKSLESTDLYCDTINGITLDNIFFKDSNLPITGKKTFNNLKTNILNMDRFNGKNASDILQYFSNSKEFMLNFGSTVNITNVEVESINGVHWNIFKDSIFRSGKTYSITGNLIIDNSFKVAKLKAKGINGIRTDNFLTRTTEQIVTAKINFGKLNSNNLNCIDINGVDLKSDTISLFDKNKNITGPVTINRAIVLKNLYANIGNNTITPKFQQIYKTVKIIGAVRIEDLHFQPKLLLTVNGKSFNMKEIENRFWLKHTDQIIPTHVKISRGITASNLFTRSLNNINIDDYMLMDIAQDRSATNYKFRNLSILGNITIDDGITHFPNLLQVNDNSVKLLGSFEISGKKTFNGVLISEKVATDYLDGVPVNEALTVSHQKISGLKRFENLIIKGNLTVIHGEIDNLNGADLNSIYDRYFHANRAVNLTVLKMEKATVRNLQTTKLNGENLNKFILNVDKVHGIKQLNRLKINGNVAVYNIVNLTHLQGVNFNIIRDKVFDEPIMVDKVKFTGDVFIKNFNTRVVNNLHLLDMREIFLSRYYANKITAKYHFKRLATNDLMVDVINNVDMTCIIDTKMKNQQTLLLKNKLKLNSVTFKKSLTGNLRCDINDILKTIKNPSEKRWPVLTILKNSTIIERSNILGTILDYAVTVGKMNVITMPVIFKRVTAKDVCSKKLINDVNIQEIYRDSLMKTNQDELVNGTKTFNILTTAGITTYGDSKIPKVNGILIQEVDSNLLPVDRIFNTLIKGHKTFHKGFYTTKLKTKQISNVEPENLVNLYDLKPIPQATFDAFHVLHNFDTSNVNSKNLTSFLENRILKESPIKQTISGIYYFDNIHLTDRSQINTPIINGIKLDDVVFDVGIANIRALKEFTEEVVIIGDIWINRTRGMNITEEYENSVLMSKEATIEASTVFKNVDRINNTTTNNLNGIPIESIKAMVLSETPKIKAKNVQVTIDKVTEIIRANTFSVLARRFLYLDKFQDYSVTIPKVTSTQAGQAQHHIMVHLISQKPGYACGLNANCTCLFQNTVQITPDHSLHLFSNKIGQRVYSYEDDEIQIHAITDAVSYSSECRSLNTSILESTTITTSNKINGFSVNYKNKVLEGYVNDVQFFRFYNNIYIIFCKMFNIETNTQESKCSIIKLIVHENKFNILQEITTTTYSKAHLIRTEQTIHLIIRNRFMNIAIYTFDQHREEFLPLREINGFHCTSVASIVIEPDNFLMLSQENNHIGVWKYNHQHKNYYFYQDLVLDSPTTSILSLNDPTGAFIYAITENGDFHIYNFQYIEGWKLISRGEVKDMQILIPVTLNNQKYLLAPSPGMISLLSLIQDGQN